MEIRSLSDDALTRALRGLASQTRRAWLPRARWVIVAVLGIAAWTSAAAQLPAPSDEDFIAAVDAVIAEPSPNARYEKAARIDGLARRLSRTPAARITPESVAKIASLLNDQLEIVRMCAAEALGYLGPQAKSAVPSLKATLAEAQHVRQIERERVATLRSRGELVDLPIHTGPDLIVSITRALGQIGAETAPEAGAPR
jgi:HEAT repeat protein